MSFLNSKERSLPEEWRTERIADAYRITRKPKEIRYGDFATIPFVPMSLIPEGGATTPSFKQKSPHEISSGTYFEKGDLLLSKITPSFENGKQAIASNLPTPFGIATTEVIPIQAIEGTSDAHFLFYHLLKSDVRKEIAAKMEGSTGRQRVPEHVVREWLIPLPPLLEQQRIAAVLWKIQKAVEIEDAVVRHARDLKKSLLRRLFTRGLCGEALKETEIGPVPKSWLEKPLGDLVEIEYGAQAAVASSLDPSIGTPILTNVNISNEGRIDLSTLRYYSVPPKKRERLILRKGDVLFNWRSGSKHHVGKTALFDKNDEFTYSSFILRFRTKGEVSSEYLCYYFYFIKSEGFFTERGNVSSINNVYNASLAATIPVAYPSLDEQHEIAGMLQTVDRKIDIHESKKRSLQELFKTLLHKLMTAQIRVNDLDIDTTEVAV